MQHAALARAAGAIVIAENVPIAHPSLMLRTVLPLILAFTIFTHPARACTTTLLLAIDVSNSMRPSPSRLKASPPKVILGR